MAFAAAPIMREIAARKLATLRATNGVPDLPLLEWIPKYAAGYRAPKHLQPLCELLERAEREPVQAVVHAPPRHAKAVACNTPMLTDRGWIDAGHVRVGDRLAGSNGEWTRVLGVYPQGVVPLFRVSFSDGSSLVTCGEHRWQVHQRYSGRARIATTADLALDLFESDGRRKWRIPIAKPLIGRRVSLPIEPYLLGVWLGDGTSARGEITSMDPEIVQSIRDEGFTTSYEYPAGRAKTYGVPGLWRKLKDLGVLNNKHVPDPYLQAPIADRLALLQGLADTDGTVAKNGSQQSICTTSARLADGIKSLVVGLGGTWTETTTRAAWKIAHNIYFRLPYGMAGFRLPRKRHRLAPFGPKNEPRRFVAAVAAAGSGPAVCFRVAARDHLFCAGRDLVVTHNTETILAALARFMQRNPKKRHAYLTYQADLAKEKSRRVQDLAQAAGVELRNRALSHWWTRAGGALFTAGVRGPFTGRGVDGLMIIDDPFKSRLEAESTTVRNQVSQWFKDVAYTRREPGCSIIIVMTRWHPQDLAGEKIASGWENICLPAVDGDGEALWPEQYSIEELRKIEHEVGAYTWTSLYQGQPRGRGGSVFEDVHFYDDLPSKMFRTGLGFDLAYTAKKYSDYSAAVAMRAVEDTYYVAEAIRKQARAPDFKRHALDFVARHGRSARRRWYCAGTELGVADLLKGSDGNPGERSLDIGAEVTKLDKFTRAQPMAAAWNAGRVLVPSQALVDSDPVRFGWVEPFVTELLGFTGLEDDHDDQVDAGVAAYDVIKRGSALGRFKAMAKM